MRPRELVEFRTPQHPSLASNNWGGSSPLLARNIPKEALEQRYLRLNTIRERDQVFPTATIEEEIFKSQPSKTIGDEIFAFLKADGSNYNFTPASKRRGRLWRWRPRKKSAVLGNSTSKWHSPRWDPKTRWPNGWC